MGGCCCHNDEAKEDDQEEKCMIVTNVSEKVHHSPQKEYGSVSTMEDKGQLHVTEPEESLSDKNHDKHSSDDDIKDSKENIHVCEDDPHNDAIQMDVHISEQETPDDDIYVADDNAYQDTKSDVTSDMSSESDDENEIDQLVAAAMATKVIYPPSTTHEQSSFTTIPHDKPSSHKATTKPTIDEDKHTCSSDHETSDTKPLSFMQRTQRSLKKAKARASTVVSASTKSNGEKKKLSSVDGRKKYHQVNKKTSTNKRNTDDHEETQDDSRKSSFFFNRKKSSIVSHERMKSRYAKDRIAKFEVEREEKEKLSSKKSAVDPRKVALERGERLGQLDDATEEMREQSSSFAQTARRLREDQRSTSTFPW